MAVLKILIIILFTIVVPTLLGLLFTGLMGERYKDSLTAALVVGTLFMFALLEVIAVPVIILTHKFSIVFWIWIVVVGIMTFDSFIMNLRRFGRLITSAAGKAASAGVIGVAAALIVAFQAGYLSWNLHYDDDDARYIPSIVSAIEKDSLFVDNPITGETMYWDIYETAKDMISPWTIFWAILSRLCMIHPAIVCHTVVPLFYIPIAYLAYVLIGRELFSEDSHKISMFVVIVSLLHIFSGYSVYNEGAFLLLRIWQGKALFASLVLPFLFWFAIKFLKNEVSRAECLIALIACVAASMTSGFGIILAPIFIFICVLIHGIYYNRWDLYVRLCACMVPNVIFAVLYAYGEALFMR